MVLTRTFLISLLFLTLTACSSDDDKSDGIPPLSQDQKGEASAAVKKLDRIQRVVDVIDGSKDVDKDIEEIVNLIKDKCSIEENSGGDADAGFSERKTVGANCPISAQISTIWRTVPINGEKFLDITSETSFSTLDTEIIFLSGIKYFKSTAKLPAGGLPSFSAEIDYREIGRVTIDDTLSGRLLPNNNIEATFLRNMRFAGYRVEVRVVIEFMLTQDEEGNDVLVPVDQKFFVNGSPTTAEEAAAFFPDAFDRLENSKGTELLKSLSI